MEIHISPESLAIVNKSCRRLGVVKLTRLVPKAMNYFFFRLECSTLADTRDRGA